MFSNFGIAFVIAAPFIYLTVLYLVDYNGSDRNSLISCKKRMKGAICCTIFFVMIVYAICKYEVSNSFVYLIKIIYKGRLNPWEAMGIQRKGLFASIFIGELCPIPTVCIYFGTLVMLGLNGSLKYFFDTDAWCDSFSDILFVRNVIVAPISEEIAFRACCVTFVSISFGQSVAIFILPLGFALCHLHHIADDIKKSVPLMRSLLTRLFQCSYCYLFGVYAAFLFIRTGNIMGPIVSHILCNLLGLPSISEVSDYNDTVSKITLYTCHVLGFIVEERPSFPPVTRTLLHVLLIVNDCGKVEDMLLVGVPQQQYCHFQLFPHTEKAY
uniref:Farnesylated proteins-converting enzyme 2 n=1 Tax=Rhabditophanes sp. KR3021 TaxID=114890 RepID=A0AC35U9U2_9BILA